MDTVFFETSSINLSMRSPETGRYLKANVYTLEGVTAADGSLRQMSIGQLVMAVCLKRSTELEADIVTLMNKMAVTTDDLDRYSKIETELANWQAANPTAKLEASAFDDNKLLNSYPTLTALFAKDSSGNRPTLATFLNDIGATAATSWTADELDTLFQKIETKMDGLNTVSQQDLIEMQSLTSKRDDTYSLISNVLKSLYTVLSGNANNL